MSRIKNLVGTRFGRLVVKEFCSLNNAKTALWKCECDCGAKKIVPTNYLTTGSSRSCGCLAKELSSERAKKIFKKKWASEQIDTDTLKIPCGGGYALIDKDDLDKIKDFGWSVWKKSEYDLKYATARSGNKTIKMHRLILGLSDSKVKVDHINRDGLDNRKSNLRKCTDTQNSYNRRIAKNNKTGVKGVYFRNGKYIATIKYNNQQFHIKQCDTKEEAQIMRIAVAKVLHGEFYTEGV